jgi:glycosyltransferase involved in cell wall biosynthesis
MKIRLENINFNSNSGPNCFGKKLKKYLEKSGHELSWNDYQHVLCFIETHHEFENKKLFQRLDGIYFNSDFDYKNQNKNIVATYKRSHGVIFQSAFNQELTERYFGQHRNSTIIHNGADTELIQEIEPTENNILDKYDNVWSCAASWRPHKRLRDNIEYYLEHRSKNDCLVVAGKPDYFVKDPTIFYAGNLEYEKLISLYKRSKYFLHLAWLDHCPNVVVDARASGCQIICSSAGGTREIAGLDAVVIMEDEWDYKPTRLYSPPEMNFKRKIKNIHDSCYDMNKVAEKYAKFIFNEE